MAACVDHFVCAAEVVGFNREDPSVPNEWMKSWNTMTGEDLEEFDVS
jgi:hypothetical protein